MPTISKSTNSLDACNPAYNATVSASAGSGKTWLLITRIVRLLIDDAEPGNIIALTFTRKAAGEMQIRLNQRLYEMATADDISLKAILQLMGSNTDAQSLVTARGLYEKSMHSLYPIRIQTFHSFCQDILSRFPLEANIPPGFELTEDSSLLERQAWQTLFNDADKNPQLDDALDFIMQTCNGPDNTHTALSNFLSHRSDWWAYTAQTNNAINFANDELTKTLHIDENLQPQADFFKQQTITNLKIFANLLLEINNKTSIKHAASITNALNQTLDNDNDESISFALIISAFIKKDGDILSQGRKYTAALEKKLGDENAQRFIELHQKIADDVQSVIEQLKRLLTLSINKAWYRAGAHYIEIFQRLKKEMRLLDFTDLEWKCYQLLQHADNAHWVQYKIDQRIDHLLIDEFQDTNPTQWHLLSPILEEIAANPEQRPRSVFLVGDEKQSIYSFRRANPALQAQASSWLAENLNAKATPLDFSRRSSAAIIHCVNQIFEQDYVKNLMPGYTTHGTHLDVLPGRVQLHDLFEEDESDAKEDTAADEPVYFRNPLEQPRKTSSLTLRHKEADYIAQQISTIINTPTLITDGRTTRPAEYGDILILMRNRLHLDIYQDA
ncbi:MAG: UvrD-helicase domain-containing protein [Gammaproteobacteria bacterium]|nr:UvrD-helicase domain-containing protein [Gammaproteobacteria bacterium]